MSVIGPFLTREAARIAELTQRLGQSVDVPALGVCDRRGHLPLAPPGRVSSNGACRLLQASDGWVALNLGRPEDRDLVPAWLGCGFGRDAWDLAEAEVGGRTCAELRERAVLLGLPLAVVGEMSGASGAVREEPWVRSEVRKTLGGVRVLDLTALWAGPMCGAILAAAGAEVTRVDSLRRPDPTERSTPGFFRALNGGKATLPLDLASEAGRARLRAEVLRCEVLITSARPAALARLGLDRGSLRLEHPGLIWVAITGYGASGAAADRVAFGDDAAAAGGLLKWSARGVPEFAGDALADPVTGLVAAEVVLQHLASGQAGFIDVSLAGCAAAAATEFQLQAAS